MRSGLLLMNFGPSSSLGEGEGPAAEALAAGKRVVVLAGALALGAAFALSPWRETGASRLDILLVAGTLFAQCAGYAAATLPLAPPLMRLLPLTALLVGPGLLLLSAHPLAQGALAACLVLGAAMEACLLARLHRLLLPLLGFSLPALVALGVGTPSFGVLAAGGLTLLAPLFAAGRQRNRHATQAAVTTQVSPAGRGALLALALAPEARRLLVTDIMGKIDAALSPPCGDDFPEASLTEATLIADRVALLQALAQVVHGAVPIAPLSLRLRFGHGGAGYPAVARFEPHVLRLSALPEAKGRIAVLIEPACRDESGVPALPQGPNPSRLARALHDGLAPFNAGLGFLEMMTDPCLAPRDFAVLHDFAAEARIAMGEAHRNAVLMGLWMRMTQDEAHARLRGELAPRRMLTEVLRLLNLEEVEKRGDLIGDVSFDAPISYTLSVNAVRFALAALLRFGVGALHVDLKLREEGKDLVIMLKRREGGDHIRVADAFQLALEEAAGRGGDIAFEGTGNGERHLRLRAVAATRRATESIRVAS